MSVLYTVNKNETNRWQPKSICQVKYNEKELENKKYSYYKNNGTNFIREGDHRGYPTYEAIRNQQCYGIWECL